MKDPLYLNKVFGVLLGTALLFFGLPILVDTFYGSGGHGSEAHEGEHGDEHDGANPLGLAYPIAFSVEGGAAPEVEEIDFGTLMADASPAAGERAAAICVACHTMNEGGADGTGPNLWGIVGRPIAAHAGFNYSGALAATDGDWTYEKLDAFLANSQAYIPGTQMAQRIGKPEKRADILAYLATLTSGAPVPFPAPAAAEPAEEAAGHGAEEPEMAHEPAADEAPVEEAAPAGDHH